MLKTLIILTVTLLFTGAARSQVTGSAYIFAEIVVPTTIQLAPGENHQKGTVASTGVSAHRSPKVMRPNPNNLCCAGTGARPLSAIILSGEPHFTFTVSISSTPVTINTETCRTSANETENIFGQIPTQHTNIQQAQIMPEGAILVLEPLFEDRTYLSITPSVITVNYN